MKVTLFTRRQRFLTMRSCMGNELGMAILAGAILVIIPAAMTILTEPIGSIRRPIALVEATKACERGEVPQSKVDELSAQAVRDTIRVFEATGSPVISDGEAKKVSKLCNLRGAWRAQSCARWIQAPIYRPLPRVAAPDRRAFSLPALCR